MINEIFAVIGKENWNRDTKCMIFVSLAGGPIFATVIYFILKALGCTKRKRENDNN